jgi:hypothetical protein
LGVIVILWGLVVIAIGLRSVIGTKMLNRSNQAVNIAGLSKPKA